MKRAFPLLALLAISPAVAQQPNDYDYFAASRQMIRNGVQAVLMCNGLYTSNRPIERVFEQEVAYLREPVGTVDGGNCVVEREYGSVAVGGGEDGLALADAWSAAGGKYVPGEVAAKWRSFRSSGVTFASLPAIARQHGADLAIISRKHSRAAHG